MIPKTLLFQQERRAKWLTYFAIAFLAYFIMVHGYTLSLIFGLIMYNLSHFAFKQLSRFGTKIASPARTLIILAIIIGLIVAVSFIGLRLFKAVQANDINNIISLISQNITDLHQTLPVTLSQFIPTETQEIKATMLEFFKEHAKSLSLASLSFSSGFLKILLGMILGSILSYSEHKADNKPLTAQILRQGRHIGKAFNKIFVAQFKISLVDTSLTALYLLIALPLFGVELPFVKTVVLLTFIFGLLPIVGNLISNTIIVLISLKAGVIVACISLAFLVVVHKLEYVLNAKIIGKEIQASVFELLFVMILFEAMFGIAGLIMATIIYAYVKQELKEHGYI